MSARALGPYQPIERLDRAGLLTYRAVDPRLLGQAVSLTVADLPPDDAAFLQRFERGAEALTALRHPNILPLLDFGESQGRVFLATPYLDGPTLGALLGQPRRPTECLGLIATLCNALDHAHRLGLTHGEITPEAIQLVNLPAGEDTLYAAWPLFLGFGFAALLGSPPAEGVAAAYLPATEAADPAGADRYALAGVLHFMLTGVPPAPGGDDGSLATLTDGLAGVLRRALGPDRAARFASGADLVMALRDAANIDRRGEDETATTLLDEARVAVAAGKLRAASEAYAAYLRLRPLDELARREFATVETRRAEVARRRAETAAASAAAAAAVPRASGPQPDARAVAQGTGHAEEAGEAGATGVPAAVTVMASGPLSPTPRGEHPAGGAALFNVTDLLGRPQRPSPKPSAPGTPASAHQPGPPRTFKPIASPARQRKQAVLPLAFGAVALVLVLVIAGAVLARRNNQAADGSAGTPARTTSGGTAVVGAGTRTTPGANPSGIPGVIPIAPTVPPVVPTVAPTLPPLPPVINDTFDNHSSGFPPEPGAQEGAGYQNGEYILKVPDPDGFEIADLGGCSINGDCTFGDLNIEVDLWAVGPTAGGSYGIVFHRQSTEGGFNQYFVLIDPEQGTLRLVRWVINDRTEVIPPTPLPAIIKGNGKNHLAITVKGNAIVIQVNGVELPRVLDPGPPIGTTALRADAGTGPIEVHFDNFVIRPVR